MAYFSLLFIYFLKLILVTVLTKIDVQLTNEYHLSNSNHVAILVYRCVVERMSAESNEQTVEMITKLS